MIDLKGYQLFTRRGLLTNSINSTAQITITSNHGYYVVANSASQLFAQSTVKHNVTCGNLLSANYQSLVSMAPVNPASTFNVAPNGYLARCFYNSYALVPAAGSMPNVATNIIAVTGNSGVDKQQRPAVLQPDPASGSFIVG